MPLESSVVNSIIRALRGMGAMVIKIHGSPFSVFGTPDLIGCWQGQCFALEVKRPDNRKGVSLKQKRELRRWSVAGAKVGIVTSKEEAIAIVTGPYAPFVE